MPLKPVQYSRDVEMNILVQELKNDDASRTDANLEKEKNEQLKRQNRKLMNIIHLLTEQMVENAKRG